MINLSAVLVKLCAAGSKPAARAIFNITEVARAAWPRPNRIKTAKAPRSPSSKKANTQVSSGFHFAICWFAFVLPFAWRPGDMAVKILRKILYIGNPSSVSISPAS